MSVAQVMKCSTVSSRWEAIKRRTRQADGLFLYGVKTTGIYCRPACSSRLPNRANIAFFTSAVEAERAGFRACKRCKPNGPLAPETHTEAIIRACKLIDEAEEPISLKDLSTAVGLSQYHFHRVFKEIIGITPKGYGAARRERRLREELHRGVSVTRAIYDAGFGSSSRFYGGAGDMLGMTPSKYKDGAANLRIRFAIAQSFLGLVLVAATERGICTIDFGKTPEELTNRLRARFPKAILQDDDPGFAAWVAAVVAFIDAPRLSFGLPLDIQGTAFQQRVWRALQAIPPGTTASYAEVAKRLGNPSAARAVAQACASNAIAVAIPCHRVVRSDGGISGYRWGLTRKRALLERESPQPQSARLDHPKRGRAMAWPTTGA